MDPSTKQDVQVRLRRIHGQVEGVQRMVEDDRFCVDILLQISAVQAALGKVGHVLLEGHMNDDVARASATEDPDERARLLADLMDVFRQYSRILCK